jgi:threonine aldolase
MIVSPKFDGDTNELLQYAQYESYWDSVGIVFRVCSAKMIEASELLQVDAEIAKQLREIEIFDHRVLQDVQDIIAMYYRYINDDFPQMPLLERVRTKEDYSSEWAAWLQKEMKALSGTPYFVRAVINAVLFANNEIGYMAENQAASYLVSRYQMRDWARADGYVKIYITPL